MEVAPGIHRIEGDLGERYVCQYLLVGEERTLLVDTGLRDMPEQVIAPYLAGAGPVARRRRRRADLPRRRRPLRRQPRAARRSRRARGCSAARPTAPWIESNAAMLAGNYRWYEAYGFGPSPEDVAFLERELGGDAPVDVGLHGGETLRLGPAWRVEVLALPGHTPGHLGLWDPRSGAAIIIDAALADGVVRPRRQPPDPAPLLLGRRLRGDDPPPARARPGAPADRALRRHGARRRARVPRSLAGLRARGA